MYKILSKQTEGPCSNFSVIKQNSTEWENKKSKI